MGELDRTITFTYRLQDNMTKPSEDAAQAQENLGNKVKETTASTDSQKISFMSQVVAVGAVNRGISSMNSGLQELGILSGSSAAAMNKLSSAVQVVSGAFQLFKGVTQVVKMLTAAEASLAVVTTYNKVMQNPANVALAATGLAVAGGVAGYFLGGQGGGGGSNVQQTVNISGLPQSESRSIARESFEIMGG